MLTAEEIIELYQLEPLDQEGGFFRQVWKSSTVVKNADLGEAYSKEGTHPRGTLIHFLLTADSFSAMHRLPTPEHWFYHLGDPVEMLLLHANGSSELIELGPDLANGQRIHYTTPAHSWQGTYLKAGAKAGYFFGSCAMVPGFEWEDFEMGDRAELVAEFPQRKQAIERRTRLERFKGAL